MGNTAYKVRHKEQGLCTNCSMFAAPHRTLCLAHIQTSRVSSSKGMKKLVIKRKALSLCIRCGCSLHEEMDIGHVKCLNCREELVCGGKVIISSGEI